MKMSCWNKTHLSCPDMVDKIHPAVILVKLIHIIRLIRRCNHIVMNQLELKHLKMIQAIAETGNITRAADKLFITQSALSQQLKDIESRLKTDLFFRTHKKMILTSIGGNLLKTADQVIGIVNEAEAEIAKTVSGEKGELKVGTHCIFCYKWLPSAMNSFQRRFPGVKFEIGASDEPSAELESKKFDIVITTASSPDDNCEYTPLFSDQLVCILPAKHPLSAQPFIRLEDFVGMDMISHAEKSKNRFYQITLKPRGIEPGRFMTVGQPQAIIDMVAAGFGVGVFPGWAVRSSLSSPDIIALPISRNGLPLTWHAAFLKRINPPIFLNEFIRIVKGINF